MKFNPLALMIAILVTITIFAAIGIQVYFTEPVTVSIPEMLHNK